MPIKSFTFAFKVDAKELLSYVIEKNIAVDIHATGTKRQEQEVVALPAVQPRLALPSPHPIAGERRSQGRIGSRAVVLFYLAQHGRAKAKELKVALMEAGYKASTMNNLMWAMREEGLISRSVEGYRILNKGLQKLEATEGDY
jgi:hypothetical protein